MTKDKPDKNITAKKSHTAIKTVYLVPLLIVIIQLLGICLPENIAWGFNFWRYLPSPFSIIILVIVFILLLPPVIKRTDPFVLAIQKTGSEIAEQLKHKQFLKGKISSKSSV